MSFSSADAEAQVSVLARIEVFAEDCRSSKHRLFPFLVLYLFHRVLLDRRVRLGDHRAGLLRLVVDVVLVHVVAVLSRFRLSRRRRACI